MTTDNTPASQRDSALARHLAFIEAAIQTREKATFGPNAYGGWQFNRVLNDLADNFNAAAEYALTLGKTDNTPASDAVSDWERETAQQVIDGWREEFSLEEPLAAAIEEGLKNHIAAAIAAAIASTLAELAAADAENELLHERAHELAGHLCNIVGHGIQPRPHKYGNTCPYWKRIEIGV